MKFTKTDPPKSPRTDYISEDGKIQLIRDESACAPTRYMAVIHITDSIAIIAKCGATPKAALDRLKEAALRLSVELRDIASSCNGEITICEDSEPTGDAIGFHKEDTHNEMD